ncbi:hypothetical protein U1Q18_043561 [Sarracenia purpurea var. burkii]
MDVESSILGAFCLNEEFSLFIVRYSPDIDPRGKMVAFSKHVLARSNLRRSCQMRPILWKNEAHLKAVDGTPTTSTARKRRSAETCLSLACSSQTLVAEDRTLAMLARSTQEFQRRGVGGGGVGCEIQRG